MIVLVFLKTLYIYDACKNVFCFGTSWSNSIHLAIQTSGILVHMFFILLFAAISGLVPLLSQLDYLPLCYDLGTKYRVQSIICRLPCTDCLYGTLFFFIYVSNVVHIVQSTCTDKVRRTYYKPLRCNYETKKVSSNHCNIYRKMKDVHCTVVFFTGEIVQTRQRWKSKIYFVLFLKFAEKIYVL